MSTFTYIMDLTVINAFAIFKEITEPTSHNKISFREFKRVVCKEFVAEWKKEYTNVRHDSNFYEEDYNKHYRNLQFKECKSRSVKLIDTNESSSDDSDSSSEPSVSKEDLEEYFPFRKCD